jgi:hypothetical protein
VGVVEQRSCNWVGNNECHELASYGGLYCPKHTPIEIMTKVWRGVYHINRGPWYYRYYEDDFEKPKITSPNISYKGKTGFGSAEIEISTPHSLEQILQICSTYIEKYGDIPPKKWWPVTHWLLEAIQIYGGFKKIRTMCGLEETHGRIGPHGHEYTIHKTNKSCLCGFSCKTHRAHRKHRLSCETWQEMCTRHEIKIS